MNVLDITPEVIAEHRTYRKMDLTVIKMGPRRKWATALISVLASRSGGDDHKAKVFRPSKDNVGFRCTCKAAEFERKCWAVKQLEKVAADLNIWGR